MGSYAHATLMFGYAWEPDEPVPSGWSDSYRESVDPAKLPEELREIWEEENSVTECLSTLLRMRGWDRLSMVSHGNLTYDWSAPAIGVGGMIYRGSIGEITQVPAELGLPSLQENDQLLAAGQELGFDISDCQWMILVDFS